MLDVVTDRLGVNWVAGRDGPERRSGRRKSTRIYAWAANLDSGGTQQGQPQRSMGICIGGLEDEDKKRK
jgi:hypothetical protein